jgi:hypothetical protein
MEPLMCPNQEHVRYGRPCEPETDRDRPTEKKEEKKDGMTENYHVSSVVVVFLTIVFSFSFPGSQGQECVSQVVSNARTSGRLDWTDVALFSIPFLQVLFLLGNPNEWGKLLFQYFIILWVVHLDAFISPVVPVVPVVEAVVEAVVVVVGGGGWI